MLALLESAACTSEVPPTPTAPIYSLQEELSIGEVDLSNYSLTEVGGLVVTADGTVSLLQHQEQLLRQYDENGVYVGSIGRGGGGPGEFSYPMFVGLQRDTIWVYDYGLSRMQYYTSAGTYLHTVILPLSYGPTDLGTRPHYRLADGRLLGITHLTPAKAAEGPRVPLLVLDPLGSVADTLAWISRQNYTLLVRNDRNPRTSEYVARQPLSDATLYAVAPDGDRVFVVDRTASQEDDARFSVVAVSHQGDTLWSRSYAYTSQRTPVSLLDSLVTLYSEAAVPRMWTTTAGAERFVRERLFLPERLPPVTAVVATTEGGLWLRREEQGHGETVQWLMLTPEGEPHGAAEAPAGLQILHVDGDQVWGTTKDHNSVVRAKRFGIRRR